MGPKKTHVPFKNENKQHKNSSHECQENEYKTVLRQWLTPSPMPWRRIRVWWSFFFSFFFHFNILKSLLFMMNCWLHYWLRVLSIRPPSRHLDEVVITFCLFFSLIYLLSNKHGYSPRINRTIMAWILNF